MKDLPVVGFTCNVAMKSDKEGLHSGGGSSNETRSSWDADSKATGDGWLNLIHSIRILIGLSSSAILWFC